MQGLWETKCERTGLDSRQSSGSDESAAGGLNQIGLRLIRVLDEIGAQHVDTVISGCVGFIDHTSVS